MSGALFPMLAAFRWMVEEKKGACDWPKTRKSYQRAGEGAARSAGDALIGCIHPEI